MAKRLKSKLPRVSQLDDGGYAIDVEPGICITFQRDGEPKEAIAFAIHPLHFYAC
jgi:hypothetical protein